MSKSHHITNVLRFAWYVRLPLLITYGYFSGIVGILIVLISLCLFSIIISFLQIKYFFMIRRKRNEFRTKQKEQKNWHRCRRVKKSFYVSCGCFMCIFGFLVCARTSLYSNGWFFANFIWYTHFFSVHLNSNIAFHMKS